MRASAHWSTVLALLLVPTLVVAGGDQRERARIKNDKKVANGPKASMPDKNQRMLRCVALEVCAYPRRPRHFHVSFGCPSLRNPSLKKKFWLKYYLFWRIFDDSRRLGRCFSLPLPTFLAFDDVDNFVIGRDAEIMRQKNEAAAKKKSEEDAAKEAAGAQKPAAKPKISLENPNKS